MMFLRLTSWRHADLVKNDFAFPQSIFFLQPDTSIICAPKQGTKRITSWTEIETIAKDMLKQEEKEKHYQNFSEDITKKMCH